MYTLRKMSVVLFTRYFKIGKLGQLKILVEIAKKKIVKYTIFVVHVTIV